MICDGTDVVIDIRGQRLGGAKTMIVAGKAIRIEWTRVNFGGERPWLICPACHRRCLALYCGPRCRKCLDLRYRVELQSTLDRLFTRARRLRRRLGQVDASIAQPIPAKPRRMRWHTYLRLRERIRLAEAEIGAELRRRCILRP